LLKFNFFVNEKQVLGFSSSKLMEILARSHTVSSDGTFFVMPKPYSQLYIIHSLNGQYRFPCCFFLLQEKNKEIYREIFKKIKEYCFNNLNIVFSPSNYVSDFETGLLSSLPLEFPRTRINGCFFHFTQGLFRKLGELGKTTNYKLD